MKIHHRKVSKFWGLIFILSVFIVSGFGQTDDCAELQNLIDKTYDFKPSKLTSEQKTVKSAEMDVVWNKVKADKEKLVPCLKKALEKPGANNFFVFDAANLLFSLERSDESKKILIASYARVDLADVNLAHWLPYISLLGFEGYDTTAAAENWMKGSNLEYYMPQHGTRKMTKEIGALAIYGSMDEKFATPALAKIAADEKHPARQTALWILMQQATPEAFEELKKLSMNGLPEEIKKAVGNFLSNPKQIEPRPGEPKTTREEYLEAFRELSEGKAQKFMKIAVAVPDGEKDAVAVMKKEDIPLIRKGRRYFAAVANPHTPAWYQSFTDILMTLLKRPEPVGEPTK